MKISLRLVGFAVGFAALALTGALAQSPASFGFQLVTTFDYPGTGNLTQPQKINDLGDIGGAVREFAVTNATATLAYQLNATNQSCGYYVDSLGVNHGYWRDSTGTIHGPIDPAGSTGTILFGNNDRNFIVGRYSDSAGATHGILFVPPNRFLVYDFPGATFTSLNGINRSNRICGRYNDPNTGIDHGIIVQLVRHPACGVTLPLAPPSAPAPAVPQRTVEIAPAY